VSWLIFFKIRVSSRIQSMNQISFLNNVGLLLFCRITQVFVWYELLRLICFAFYLHFLSNFEIILVNFVFDDPKLLNLVFIVSIFTSSFSVSKDFQQLESVRVNCSGARKSPKKVLTFDATDDIPNSSIYRKFFSVLVQSNSDFHDYSMEGPVQVSHIHKVIRPIIYVADESLSDLSPAQ
jgi:hypothetical protein